MIFNIKNQKKTKITKGGYNLLKDNVTINAGASAPFNFDFNDIVQPNEVITSCTYNVSDATNGGTGAQYGNVNKYRINAGTVVGEIFNSRNSAIKVKVTAYINTVKYE